MCFSATASFTSGTLLIGAGVLATRKARGTKLKSIAGLPLLFGIQQCLEGVLWLGLQHESFAPFVTISAFGFLIFAWVVWPLFVPYAIRRAQTKNDWRKKLLMGTQVVGAVVAISLTYVLFFKGIDPQINGRSINYNVETETDLKGLASILYLACTVLPPILSNVKGMWILGVITGINFAIAMMFYNNHVLSVWCFFAAITSIMILVLVYTSKKIKLND